MAENEKPPHNGLKKGLYVIPTAFTAANIGMGFLSVLACVHGFQQISINADEAARYFNYAAIAIGLAILFDTLDGRVARMTRTSTELGVQLDSLADVLTFGIAPIVLAYCWAVGGTFPEGSGPHSFGLFVLFMYLMCGVFRLARFNIQATRPRVLLEGAAKVDKKNFVGLPIPPSAGLIASIVHFAPHSLVSYGEAAGHFYTIAVMVMMICLGLLMVSTLRYTSFKNAGTGKGNLYIVLGIAAIGMLVWLYSQYMLLILSGIYVSHGIIWYILGLFRSHKPAETKIESNQPNPS
ncbi:MAG: phosphatidylcholine/phosphatidylserine synthase [Pyrinomonadaceae bacterium]